MQVKNQSSDESKIQLTFSFDPGDLRLEYSLIGDVVHLADCPTVGEPGSPALPNCIVRVALPPHTVLTEVQAEARDTVRIKNEALPLAPLQPLRPGRDRKDAYHRPDEEQRDYRRKAIDPRREEKPFVEPFPTPPFVPADRELYVEATRRPTARALQTTAEGLTPVATINLNPVRLTADGLLEFSSQIDLTVRYKPAEDRYQRRQTSGRLASRSQAMRQVALTRMTVVNPELVLDYTDLYPIFNLGTDYLIVTDNQQWNAETMVPTGAAGGDLVASFARLVAWKRQRGLRARVVTISNIMADHYGNFRTGSRDLQEVIRRFLKKAHADWGVTWVLLGGDTEIVPIRRAASDALGGVGRQATNPPPDNTSFWTGSHLRMHVVNPGVWWGASSTNLLVRPDNGMVIPYDAAGTSNSSTRGWYFTSDETYSTRTTMPTNFVRVNGPSSEINADLQFLYEWNTIPTDLYYSSLVGPQYDQPGRHDWDLTDNGVYAQHAGTNLDGVNFTPTVSLGRASVHNSAQADTFVNKVITYEKFQRPDGTGLDSNWPKRVVLVSENWGGRIGIGSTGDSPPGNNQYHHVAGTDHSLIKLQDTPDYHWSLLTYISEADVRLLPYRMDAATIGRGWYFARSDTDLSPNTFTTTWWGTPVTLPLPSQWVAVYGAAEELAPTWYIFNNTELDGSLADQEALRAQLQTEMRGFDSLRRLYQDIEDMTPAQTAAGPVELITTAGLRAALNAGPHIVSLSGHGSSWGCCELGHDVADSLTNGYHSFIAYADSCLTNQLDADAVSEHLIANSNGGAVAYIGSTRFSWIGVGDDYQRRFFNQWSTLGGNAHLGLLCDTRATLYGSDAWWYRWPILSLNLTGDPEMPLWWCEPLIFHIPEIYAIDELRLLIDPNPPDPPFFIDDPYRRNWGLTYVHVRQGDQEKVMLADAEGRVEMPLTEFQTGAATLTVTRPGHQPVVREIKLVNSSEPKRGCNRTPKVILTLFNWLGSIWGK